MKMMKPKHIMIAVMFRLAAVPFMATAQVPGGEEALSEAKGVVPAGTNHMNGRKQYVTDAPFVWKDEESGNLIMIMSSMTAGGYGILQAISPSGKIDGPWELDNPPVFTNKGGHAHIFRDLNGKLRIVFFRKKQGKTQVCIKPLFIEDGKILPL